MAKNRFFEEGRFERKPGEPRYLDKEMDIEQRLNEILADIVNKLTMPMYARAETSVLQELKSEEAELVVQSDGEHFYAGRKILKDPKQLSVLEIGIYAGRIEALEWGAKVQIFSADDNMDDETAKKLKCFFGNKLRLEDTESVLHYIRAFRAKGINEDDIVQKILDSADEIRENPKKYAPKPERATEYLAACVELMKQVVENHRFTKEIFEIVYRPLERLARQLMLYPPEFSERDREIMEKGDEMTKREINIMLKGAKQCHQYYCQVFEVYQKLANEILEG